MHKISSQEESMVRITALSELISNLFETIAGPDYLFADINTLLETQLVLNGLVTAYREEIDAFIIYMLDHDEPLLQKMFSMFLRVPNILGDIQDRLKGGIEDLTGLKNTKPHGPHGPGCTCPPDDFPPDLWKKNNMTRWN